MEVVGAEITWATFRIAFLEKYFPADVRYKKGIEFLELKQWSLTVAEYATKFEELVKFCPHIIMQLLKSPSVSSLRAGCVLRSNRALVIMRFVGFLLW